MDQETKVMFGKLLGEMYRIEKRLKPGICPASDETIYGLLNGLETIIDEQFENVGFVSKQQFDHVGKVLNEIYQDDAKLKNFKGFYDVEGQLQQGGVDRGTAIRVLRYFAASGGFAEILKKMDSSNSPGECRTFELHESDT